MSSDEIDMAFYCNHMAMHLVRENSDFEIYAPVVMNAEVMAYNTDFESVRSVGIGQKREHLKRLALESYPKISHISDINPSSLAYALEAKLVDGVVLDISKAGLLEEYGFVPLSNKPYISFSLVLRKDLIDTKRFDDFKLYYNDAIDLLNDNDYLKDVLNLDSLNNLDIRFLKID